MHSSLAPARRLAGSAPAGAAAFATADPSSRPPIVIRYSPNLVVHAPETGNADTFQRRVMAILERNGRQLHQVLTREMARQRRTEF